MNTLLALATPVIVAALTFLSYSGPTVLRVPGVGGTGTSTYTLKTTGRAFWNTSTATDVTSDKEAWVKPESSASEYECQATLTAGVLSTGTTGSFLDMGAADRTWTVTRSGTGDSQATFTLDCRLKTTTTTRRSQSITLDVSVP